MRDTGPEIEVKLRIADVSALRARLRRLGAKPTPRVFEENVLCDNAASELRRSGRLLRIRIETPAPAGSKVPRNSTRSRGVLTYKAPVSPSWAAELSRRYKAREEIEISFQPAGTLESIFSSIGLRPGFRYEKFRTSYRLRRIPGLCFDLDETPLGAFLELEGSTAAIDRAASLLGFSPQDYITGTYWDLYVADARGRNAPIGNLVFKNRKK